MPKPTPQDPNKSIRDTFKQTKILNRRQPEPIAPGETSASSNSLLSPALEEEIAAIQKIFAEAEGGGGE